jgi:RNase P subunit RPR2
MRIINGSVFTAVQLSCKSCHTNLLADQQSDFKRVCGSQPPVSWDYVLVECPVCGTVNRLEATALTKESLAQIQNVSSGL